MDVLADNQFKLLPIGNEAFTVMLSAIDNATSSIRLETYIYRQDNIGDRFRQSLIAAAKRGVKVNVLIDGFGSYELPESFWNGLKSAGGKVRRFNPLTFSKFAFRDHRKILVCDNNIAFIGGFNIAQEYEGDGVNQGWCDHGAEIKGSLVPELSVAFDEMFEKAHLEHSAFEPFKFTKARRAITYMHGTLILSGPGRGGNILKRWLINDLKKAHNVWIEMAYFLPPWRIRRMFSNIISRRKGNVKLILAGKTDVKIAKLAAQNLYWQLLRRGIEIYEYQPQILHAKLMVVDNILYIGSANLDTRSLQIDYEVVLRVQDKNVASEGRSILKNDLKHSLMIDPQTWKKSRGFFQGIKEDFAYFLLARFDPLLARYLARRFLKTEAKQIAKFKRKSNED